MQAEYTHTLYGSLDTERRVSTHTDDSVYAQRLCLYTEKVCAKRRVSTARAYIACLERVPRASV